MLHSGPQRSRPGGQRAAVAAGNFVVLGHSFLGFKGLSLRLFHAVIIVRYSTVLVNKFTAENSRT